MKNTFIFDNSTNIHIKRRREILAAHPEIKTLYGNYTPSAIYISLIVLFQLAMSYTLKNQSAFIVFLISYSIGAFANHSLYVMIHECCHNVVLKSVLGNKIMGIVCDIPLFLPSAMGFRKYHMIHHKHLGEYSYDPDITSYTEGKLIGNSPLRKALWLSLFSLSQALRPIKVKFYQPLNFWTITNVIVSLIVNVCVYFFMGPMALLYLGLSTLFALGLHPLGGRWIQEHFVTKDGQETYSYYGPLNKLTFNMGHHNEHHDFMNVAWINQPKIRALAPEFYNNLKCYTSWTKVLINFIFDSNMNAFTRIVHPDRHPKGAIDNEQNLYSKEIIETFF